jgi:hypothetical protein
VHADGGGANASDPTAAVNFIDFRFQAFDLNGSADRDRYAVEGAYILSPEHKLTFEINYWDTDITGKDESGLESASESRFNYTEKKARGIIMKNRFAFA